MRTYLGLLTNAVRSALRSKHDRMLEDRALRQQLAVLTGQRARTRTKPADRLFWSWLSRYWPGWRSTLVIVQPETVIRWHRTAWMQSRELVPNYESSMQKMFGSESAQRSARRGINMLGLAGALKPGSPHAVLSGQFCQAYMQTVALTIAAGTSEIQRNIIATRGLGLPRG